MNLKNNNFSILISSAGRRVELLKIWEDTVRSYFGKKCKIICSDMNPEYSAACQISKNFSQLNQFLKNHTLNLFKKMYRK